MAQIRGKFSYANVVATLALFLALSGGVYAASKINGASIKKESVPGNRLKSDDVTGEQVDESSLGRVPTANKSNTADSADSASNSAALGGQGPGAFQQRVNGTCGSGRSVQAVNADGYVACGGDVVQGSGTLLSNRIVFTPQANAKTLLTIPGLGRLDAYCLATDAYVEWVNDTASSIDMWAQHLTTGPDDTWISDVKGPGETWDEAESDFGGGSTLSLGVGNDPGARRVATIDMFSFQSSNGAPCGFQAQGTLWTSS
jgi:hypothetical protein